MFLLLALVTVAVAQEPVKIGDISTFQHAASGELWALDEKTLMVKNFNYDGAGPDAFFWVGTEGSPNNVADDKTAILAHPFQGVHYEYRDTNAPILKAASQEQITLFLPKHLKVSDLKWFSVWCRAFSKDFGSLNFDGSSLQLSGGDLPAPLIPPSNSIEEPKSEPEPEAEAEAEPEPEHGDGSNHIGEQEPKSEPSTKGEPKPENGSSTVVISSLLMFMFFWFI